MWPTRPLTSSSSRATRCANVPDSRERMARVDLDAGALHVGDDGNQRPLQRLVDRRHALGGEPRLQHHPQPQRHVGVLGGVLGRLVDRHLRERLLGLLGARRVRDHLVERDAGVAEVALGEIVHAVAAAAAVERVGEQHGVVERRDVDAVLRQHSAVVLDVLADLQDGRRPRAAASAASSASRERRSAPSAVAAAEIEAAGARAMAERHVAGLARRDRQREADEIGVHRIERRSSRCRRRRGPPGVGRRDPGLEALARRDGLVLGAVERRLGARAAASAATAPPACSAPAGVVPSALLDASARLRRLGRHGRADRDLERRRRLGARAPRRCAASAC